MVEVIKADRESPFSLVDVGCAADAFLHYAKNELPVSNCTGIEISDVDLGLALTHVEGVEFVQDSITALTQTEGRQFDVCTCLETIDVFDDPDPVLQNLIRLVRPGGALYLCDLVNDHPGDVVVRYRRADQPRCEPGRSPQSTIPTRSSWERVRCWISRSFGPVFRRRDHTDRLLTWPRQVRRTPISCQRLQVTPQPWTRDSTFPPRRSRKERTS